MSEPAATHDPSIRVEVWFDVRCPWCFLGKRRLERAIEVFEADEPGIPVMVTHHSFELAPGIPERFDGSEAEYLLRYEGVPLEQSARTLPALRELAAAEGVVLRFDELVEVNTRRAHRVFQYGKAQGMGEELLDRLFRAYFTECRDLADPETLAALAAEAGLDREEALLAAGGSSGAQGPAEIERAAVEAVRWDRAVEKDDVRARMLGASGVPYALVNAKYRISGAQRAEVFAGALHEVARRDFSVG